MLAEQRPPSEAGPIAGGGVSIVVQSIYPDKQEFVLSRDVSQEAENTVAKVVRQAQRCVDMSSNGITITGRTTLAPSEF